MADSISTEEIWRVIDDAPDYSISNRGRVRRDNPDWQGKYAGRVLTPSRDRGGYSTYVLCANGRKITRKAHRLVCTAFNGPQPDGRPHCAHRDGDVANNSPTNLYWATALENAADRERHGRTARGIDYARGKRPTGDRHWTRLHPERVQRGFSYGRKGQARGSANHNAKLTESQVVEIRGAPYRFGICAELARRFGVSNGLITAIRKGRAWTHVLSPK